MQQVERVRRFNRFYTRRIGALRAGLLGSPHPLPEARLLYELGRRGSCSASELSGDLDLDPGYLSRLLHKLRRQGLVRAERSREDARRSLLSLTGRGHRSFAMLDGRSRAEVGAMLGELPAVERSRLVGAMETIERLLGARESEPVIELRPHRPGDIGWVVHRHGVLYAREYGWDERFEALVAGIAKSFVENHDPARERCWIAEMDGEPVGSVFLVKQSRTTAQLRLLLVEPRARGRGLGKRLVQECIAFARDKGYRRLVLWTQSNLAAARAIYESCGFRLAKTERHAAFGVKLTGEFWELPLG